MSYSCPKCLAVFLNLGDHSKHQRTHQFEKKFLFVCGEPNCLLQFKTFMGLDVHLSRFHRPIARRVITPRPSETGSHNCSVPFCNFKYCCIRDVCRHVLADHCKAGEAVRCPLSSHCQNEVPIKNLQAHLSKYHRGWTKNDVPCLRSVDEPPSPSTTGSIHPNTEGFADDDTMDSINEEDDDFDLNENQEKKDLIRSLAKFYLMMESEYLMPAATVQKMCEGFSNLLEQNMSLIKKRLLNELEELKLTEDLIDSVVNKVVYSDALFSAHHKNIGFGPWLSTSALRLSYYKKHFRYIDPMEYNLTDDPNNPVYIYYSPIEETLKLMLACPSVQRQVDASFSRVPSENNVLSDYHDGTLYRKKTTSSTGKVLDLFLFQDAFKPTNDLSKAAKKHSTLGVYCTLGNFKPHIRAKLDALQMVMLVPNYKTVFKEKELRKKCFERLVADLKRLETTGIEYKGEKVKVRLLFIIGDNLGQHEIGGFIQCFSGSFFCRYCPIRKLVFQVDPWAREPFRTKEQYSEFMAECTRREQLDPNVTHFKGVKSVDYDCPFHALENFHVCDPALPPCIGHDLFLGVVQRDLSAIISNLVGKGWFDLDLLNKLKDEFPLKGKDGNSRPGTISAKSLGGNAVQNWTLLRLLPMIIKKRRIKDTL